MTFNKVCGSEGDGTVPRRTRRQALTVIAVASCLPFFPRTGAMAKAIDSLAHQWRGTALGAEATITLHHPNSQRACHLIELCIAEIERLERVFSLYRPASELARLSRTGRIDCPSPELVALLEASRRMALLSNGAFDPTVQPLWRLYAAHADAARRLPDRRTLAAALRLVGFGNVEFDRRRIRLTEPGMSVTLNGIAQGYISDRVGDLLRDAGLESVLVELGEIVAIGRPAAGTPWRVALASPDGARPRSPGVAIELIDAAIATSGAYGTRLDPVLGSHHLFDPRTGACPEQIASVSVVARRAVLADALSTALYVEPSLLHDDILKRAGAMSAVLVHLDGRATSFAA